MRHLDGLYTRRFNINEGRDGSIFRGRYKAILIEKESYLLQVSRYIHLNPVEAKLCQQAADYVWSSYTSFINKIKIQNWLITDLILSHFNDKKSYIDFVNQGNDDKIKKLYQKSSSIFGEEEFIQKHLAMVSNDQRKFCLPDIQKTLIIPTIKNIIDSVATYFNVNIEDIISSKRAKLNWPRKIAILISSRYGHYSYQEISNNFRGISSNSISTLILRLEKDVLCNHELNVYVEEIAKIIFRRNV